MSILQTIAGQKIAGFLATAGLVFGLALGTAAAAEQVKLGIAAEPYPPFASPDASGEWTGWEVDIGKALCQKAGLDCVVTPVAWDGIIPALTSSKIDMIVASMSITAEREKTIDFSDKYYNTPTVVIGAKDADYQATPEGMTGKIIGVQIATVHEAYVRKHFPNAAEIKVYQTQDEANQDLVAGRIDATQADSLALDTFLKSSDGAACCKVVGEVAPDLEILGPGVGVGLRKGDTAMKEKMNAAIKAIRDDGTYATISKKYFEFDIFGG